MNLILNRIKYTLAGIFGELRALDGAPLCVTLEHSYNEAPKLPPGSYLCKRGPHRLHSMTEDFTTFEVTEVPGHQGILFHMGNTNNDSEGCILLGDQVVDNRVVSSRHAFERFMKAQEGCDSFTLVVQ